MTSLVPAMRNALRRAADRLSGRHVPVRTEQAPVESWTGRPIRKPRFDVLERSGEMRLVLDVPGAELERTTVTSAEGVLTVHVERQAQPDWHLAVALPEHAEPAQARSALDHGVLTIDVPLRAGEPKVHRIPVQSA